MVSSVVLPVKQGPNKAVGGAKLRLLVKPFAYGIYSGRLGNHIDLEIR